MSTSTARQPAGVPVGGQFVATAHPESEVALAPWCRPLGFVPQDLTGLDTDELAVLRRGVQAKLDRARFVVDGADHDHRQASNRGDRSELDKVTAAEREAEGQLESGLVDLHRITAAAIAGKMSRDDMTPEQREQTDATHRHAYDYADTIVGGSVLATQDEAEEYAGYVVDRLIRNDFDESSFSHAWLLPDFDRARAGRLAAKTVDGPDQKMWVAAMASGGMSTGDIRGANTRSRRVAANELSRLADELVDRGFYVERKAVGGSVGVTFRLTGGRPRPDQGTA